MTSEYKGYKTLPRKSGSGSNRKSPPIKTRSRSLEFRPFMLAGDAFNDKCRETESLLAQGTDACSADVLWTASILFYQQGKFSQAMEALAALIRKDPSARSLL